MSKLSAITIGTLLGAAALAVPSVAQGSADIALCAPEGTPAILVHVVGLRSTSGNIRVQAYGGDPARYFDKGTYLKRIDLPAGAARQVCVPLPAPGTYAVSVRHDTNVNGKSDFKDGGGMSGNPRVALLDLIFKRKPDPRKVQIRVGNGVTQVNIVMNYVQGGAFAPLPTAAH